MIPRTFGESARRGRPPFVRRATFFRSLPASTGRGSGTLARTSWLWCRTLRFRTRPPHAALGTQHSATTHHPPALSPQPSAISAQHQPQPPHSASALSLRTQPRRAAPRTRHSAIGNRQSAPAHPAIGTRQSAPGNRPPSAALSTQHSALGTRHAARGTPHSASASTLASALNLAIAQSCRQTDGDLSTPVRLERATEDVATELERFGARRTGRSRR